ncbi:MAG: tRNA-dihydrouridine synthase family protein [Fimbriimonas sp.]|nr:tRNA-dihydrouridine synthase family protein [Fimbriimonas sp.]
MVQFIDVDRPALVLAPMEGITDAPMRALQGATGAFSFAVSEFIRVSTHPIPTKVYRRDVPELNQGGRTPTGMLVQVQILGGDPERMAASAINACQAGAGAIDINFGCPAKTVNRNDGGATLLKYPHRIREIVRAVRQAVPSGVPISAKLRLGWDRIDEIHENAAMAVEGGASWITIHARTRVQGYLPPVFWEPIAEVRRDLPVPVVANGDIWNLDDFHRCREATGCRHFMIGRGALANPMLARQIAGELGIGCADSDLTPWADRNWPTLLGDLEAWMDRCHGPAPVKTLLRLKQWLKLAATFGTFSHFAQVKAAQSIDEFYLLLSESVAQSDLPALVAAD